MAIVDTIATHELTQHFKAAGYHLTLPRRRLCGSTALDRSGTRGVPCVLIGMGCLLRTESSAPAVVSLPLPPHKPPGLFDFFLILPSTSAPSGVRMRTTMDVAVFRLACLASGFSRVSVGALRENRHGHGNIPLREGPSCEPGGRGKRIWKVAPSPGRLKTFSFPA